MRAIRDVELENSGNHNHGLRSIAVFEHCVFEGLGTIDKETAAEAPLILNDPAAAAVLADAKQV
jgi:hypothetical protein